MYIRTKNGRIYDLESKEVSSWEYIDNDTAINEYKVECAFYTIYYYNGLKGHYLECDNKGGYSCDFIEEKEILKQVDTIEELCDEFLIMDNGRCMEIFSNYDNLKSSGWYRSDIDIYGAIYTDKGLIYVAKMNDKGELELI